jgi:hypothetical protein
VVPGGRALHRLGRSAHFPGNEFVVGYGLDYKERYRNLRDIGTLAPHVYS